MSQISQTSIIQNALRHLQEVPVMSPTDNRPITRALNDAYPICRDTLLGRHLWGWAKKQAILSPEFPAPPHGWLNAYPLPADYITLVPLTDDGTFDGTIIPHAIMGLSVMTNTTGPLPVTYVARVSEAFFSAAFAKALAVFLALEISQAVTSKITFTDMLGKMATGYLGTAVADDKAKNRVRFKSLILTEAYNRIFSGKDSMAGDADTVAYDLKLQYATTLQECLELHPWNFATEREILEADEAGPLYGWRYRYAKPAGMLRIAQPTVDGVWDAPNVNYRIEQGWIVSNIGPMLKVEYVLSVTDETAMSATFRSFVAVSLAAKVVTGTDRAKLFSAFDSERTKALDAARMHDSVQGTMQRPQADYWENARYGVEGDSWNRLDDGRGGGWN